MTYCHGRTTKCTGTDLRETQLGPLCPGCAGWAQSMGIDVDDRRHADRRSQRRAEDQPRRAQDSRERRRLLRLWRAAA